MNEKNIFGNTVDIQSKPKISFKAELARKSIHLLSLTIPIGYCFIEKSVALFILIPLTILIVMTDILSKKINWLGKLITFLFGRMLRKHELPDSPYLNGASWVTISAVSVIAAFPKFIAIVSLSILIISDICAAIFGRAYGKHKIYDKSIEGSTAFFISSIIIVICYYFIFSPPVIFLAAGFIAAFFATLAELMSNELDIDDNISIPFSAGMAFWVVSSLVDNFGMSFAYLLK